MDFKIFQKDVNCKRFWNVGKSKKISKVKKIKIFQKDGQLNNLPEGWKILKYSNKWKLVISLIMMEIVKTHRKMKIVKSGWTFV